MTLERLRSLAERMAVNPLILLYEVLIGLTVAAAYAVATGYVSAEPMRLAALGGLFATFALVRYCKHYIVWWWEGLCIFDTLYVLQMSPWSVFPLGMLVCYLFDLPIPR